MTAVKTNFIYPPIPIRKFDWIAWFDGYEETKIAGYGETEAEAVSDLWREASESKFGELLDSITREMFECGYCDLTDEVKIGIANQRFLQVA